MIDSSKSPMPVWRRYANVLMLTVLLVVMGYVVWVKELHHSSPASSTPPAPAARPAAAPASKTSPMAVSTATTIPGGIPVSGRNPFGS
jgi:hypothetical protein